MRRYVWRGHIEPAEGARGLDYSGAFASRFGDTEGRIAGRIQIRGTKCAIVVAADELISQHHVANNIRSTGAGILDMLGLVDGHGRTLVLESGRDLDTGADLSWSGSIAELALDPAQRDGQLNELLDAFRLTPLLGDALADYRRAILEPWDSGFYAFRCVETIQRHWQSGSVKNTAKAWESMRTALVLDRRDLDKLKPWADLQRHGGRCSISLDEHTQLLLVARETLRKFAHYLLEEDENDNPHHLRHSPVT